MKFQAFLATKVCVEGIQTDFKSKLLTMEDEELNTSTELGTAKKLAKMKNVMAMAYMTQCLSSTTMLNAIINIQLAAGWPTGKACQLFDNLKQRCNPYYKLLRSQMIISLRREKI